MRSLYHRKKERDCIHFGSTKIQRKDKESRIRFNKGNDYIQALNVYGLKLQTDYIKHLDGPIWELRPVSDRILFGVINDNEYVLLHHFVKKTQKTPSREIEKALREFADFMEEREQNER